RTASAWPPPSRGRASRSGARWTAGAGPRCAAWECVSNAASISTAGHSSARAWYPCARACGWTPMTERRDVLVIGAGPAGLAAAAAAAAHGARVAVLDAQGRGGGQVWRHDVTHALPAMARRHLAAVLNHPRVDWMPATRVVAAAPGRVLVEGPVVARWLPFEA